MILTGEIERGRSPRLQASRAYPMIGNVRHVEPERKCSGSSAVPGRWLKRIVLSKVVNMGKEHIPTGSKVDPGIYRCNACANKYECTFEGDELPMCPVCDSISWRTQQIAKGSGEKSNERT